MSKPCGHAGRVEGCPACLLATDPQFARAWGEELPAGRSLPCLYLGDVTDKVGCNCPGRWRRRCSLLKRDVTITDDCRTCVEYDP